MLRSRGSGRSDRLAACALAALLTGVIGAGAAHAQYLVEAGSGVQLQLGDGLPLPLQAPQTPMGAAIGTGTMFPPLLIPPAPAATVVQTAGPDPKRLVVAPGVFQRPAAGPTQLGVARHNPALFQVQTNAAFSAPGVSFGSATLSAGGRTGASITTFAGPAGSSLRYVKTQAQFGGPLQLRLAPATPIRVWLRPNGALLPCKHPSLGGSDSSCFARLVHAWPGSQAAPGGPVGFLTSSTGSPAPRSPGIVAVSAPDTTGRVLATASLGMTFSGTNAASSSGFPWTTGRIEISQSGALGTPEAFAISGMDGRVNGVGTLSLVAASLSSRTTTGPNAGRAWMRYVLPEPAPILGTAAALAALGLCHRLARGRRR